MCKAFPLWGCRTDAFQLYPGQIKIVNIIEIAYSSMPYTPYEFSE